MPTDFEIEVGSRTFDSWEAFTNFMALEGVELRLSTEEERKLMRTTHSSWSCYMLVIVDGRAVDSYSETAVKSISSAGHVTTWATARIAAHNFRKQWRTGVPLP